MTQEHVQLLYELVDNELKILVNEYDPDTGRIPSKKRRDSQPILEAIRDKVLQDQSEACVTTNNGLKLVVIEKLKARDIPFEKKEKTLILQLINQRIADIQKKYQQMPVVYNILLSGFMKRAKGLHDAML